MMRSPEVLKVITKSTIQYLIEKNEVQKDALESEEKQRKSVYLKKII